MTDSPYSELAAWRDALDAEGKRVVYTSGCFDILHAGHVRYLAQARELGDALVVALNSDDSVRALKGPDRPVFPQDDRAEVLLALRSVDRVAIFDGERSTPVIRALRPHLFAKGGDYTPDSVHPEEKAALDSCGAEIRILPLVPGRSTTAALAKANAGGGAARKLRLGVLGSGKGSNFQAIADAIAAGSLDAEIALVISDQPDAPILDKARALGIPAVHVDPGAGGSRSKLSPAALKEICDRLRGSGANIVALAGFMRILKEPVLTEFAGRLLNIHPSLLPKFPGLGAWRQALEAGDSESGCTVHLVDAGIDSGEILAQARVPILPGDTAESLHARIQEQEHRLFPKVIGDFGARLKAAQ